MAARTVTVTSVTDGDTFDTCDGQTVRVLGIDAFRELDAALAQKPPPRHADCRPTRC